MVRQKKYKTTLREDVLRTVKENKEVSYRELKARLAVQDSSLKKALNYWKKQDTCLEIHFGKGRNAWANSKLYYLTKLQLLTKQKLEQAIKKSNSESFRDRLVGVSQLCRYYRHYSLIHDENLNQFFKTKAQQVFTTLRDVWYDEKFCNEIEWYVEKWKILSTLTDILHNFRHEIQKKDYEKLIPTAEQLIRTKDLRSMFPSIALGILMHTSAWKEIMKYFVEQVKETEKANKNIGEYLEFITQQPSLLSYAQNLQIDQFNDLEEYLLTIIVNDKETKEQKDIAKKILKNLHLNDSIAPKEKILT